MNPPKDPAGPYAPRPNPTRTERQPLIDEVAALPQSLRAATAGLSEDQLDVKYRNWTLRQITHHLADSHMHSYLRFKWTLTEDHPTIKPYKEGDWASLEEAKTGSIEPSLKLLEGLHDRWTRLLRTLSDEDFARTFHHPEAGKPFTLGEVLGYYAWHGRHHVAQITWVKEHLFT